MGRRVVNSLSESGSERRLLLLWMLTQALWQTRLRTNPLFTNRPFTHAFMGRRNKRSYPLLPIFSFGCGRDKVFLVFRLNGDIYNKEYLSQGKHKFPAQAKWYLRKVSQFLSLGLSSLVPSSSPFVRQVQVIGSLPLDWACQRTVSVGLTPLLDS